MRKSHSGHFMLIAARLIKARYAPRSDMTRRVDAPSTMSLWPRWRHGNIIVLRQLLIGFEHHSQQRRAAQYGYPGQTQLP
jgi:hypothetical protein